MPEDLLFPSGDGMCAATLYRPTLATETGVACVVMANGFSLTRRDGLPLFAERFAAAGLAVLAFDFRHLGDSSGEPRQLVDFRRQRTDLAAAVGVAPKRNGVDTRRIGGVGLSLGGGHANQSAAEHSDLAAAVALCPLADGLAVAMASDPRITARLMAASVHDRVVRRPVRIPAVGPPGSVAVLNQPEALPGFDSVRAHDSVWRNEACAGPFIRTGLFRPVRVAHRVSCPLMLCAAANDTIVPLKPIARAAERAPHGELHRFPIGHFDAFRVGNGFERVAAEQKDFLARHLAPRRP